MINVSAASIRRPLPAILAFALATIGGLLAFRDMGVADFPDIDIPIVRVKVTYAGASPGQLETEVTRKVEDAIANLQGIDKLTSTVMDGASTTVIEFELERDIDAALAEVRDAISRIRSDLPQDINEPNISQVNIAGGNLITFAVFSASLDVADLSWFVDDQVNKALLAVPGVGSVSRVGGIDREVRVDLDPTALSAWGLSAGEVSRQLRRVQAELPGGRANWSGGEQSVRLLGTVENFEALKAFPIALQDGRRLRLDQLATVTDGAAERRQLALLGDEEVVAFSIQRARGATEVEVAEGARKALDTLRAAYPSIEIRQVSSIVERVEQNFVASMHMLLEGALLAVVVVWFFLRDWRATWITAAALPLSIIPTFLLMQWMGFTLNTVTLLALSLVVGILVDDAIVEIENIVRHQREGKEPLRAAMEAADEIGVAVIATSLTIAAVFLPVTFMPGIPGRFFQHFGFTAVAAVLLSLAVARMLTPMMAAYLIRPNDKAEIRPRWLDSYVVMADWTLHHRFRTLVAATLVFFLSMSLLWFLPTGFIPKDDLDESLVRIELAPGASLADTRAVAERAVALLQEEPDVVSIFTAIGAPQASNAPGGRTTAGDVRSASLTVNRLTGSERIRNQTEFEAVARELLDTLPGVRTSFGMGDSGETVTVVLAGNDAGLLNQTAAEVERELRSISGLGRVRSSAALLRPEVLVRPDFARAADLGVTTEALADTIRIATSGDVNFRLPKLNLPTRQVPIRVQLIDAARQDPSTLALLRVPAAGGSVPLSSVASIELGSGPAEIDRFQRMRNVNIDVELNGRPLSEVEKLVEQAPTLQALPEGIVRGMTGDSERQSELFGSFIIAMFTGVFCVYAILAILFNHAIIPVSLLIALPMSIGGAFGGLLLTGNALTMPALIGMLMLMGIAVKNSILLVDYAIIAEERGLPRHEAIIDACRKRARPIVMTSIAMGAGMLPVALGLSGDSTFRAPMGIAVIGGLVSSTVLSLLVVPAAYSFVAEVVERLGWRVRSD
ncbi:MAG: efflux RND transporter permease subunit [Steroidobacteraceae bacterium]